MMKVFLNSLLTLSVLVKTQNLINNLDCQTLLQNLSYQKQHTQLTNKQIYQILDDQKLQQQPQNLEFRQFASDCLIDVKDKSPLETFIYSDFQQFLMSPQKATTNIEVQNSIKTLPAQAACPVNYEIFQDICTESICIHDNLYRLKQLRNILADLSIPDLKEITYSATQQRDGDQVSYQIKIQYLDQEDNQIISRSQTCIDWRIYANKNTYEIDHTRQLLNDNPEMQPLWPLSVYNYRKDISAAEITFSISQRDLNENKCIQIDPNDQKWECFFEFTFTIRNISQASYFMSIKINLNEVDSDYENKFQFSQIQEIKKCDQNSKDSNCIIEVTVPSVLEFCSDEGCTTLSDKPYQTLSLGQVFYMMHRITNQNFASSWLIRDSVISYYGQGFKLKLSGTDAQTISVIAGQTILKLTIPVVSQNVIIKAEGTLSPQNTKQRMLLDQNKVLITQAQTKLVVSDVQPQKQLQMYQTNIGRILLTIQLICFYMIL